MRMGEEMGIGVRKDKNILGATNNELQGIATGLIAEETEGVGFVTKGYRRKDDKKKWVTKDDKSHLKCEECGMSRHTKEQCFRIVGYPDWWTDGNKKGTKTAKTEKENIPTTNTSFINKENTSAGRRSDGGFGGLAATGNKGVGGDFSIAEQVKEKHGYGTEDWDILPATEDTVPNLISEVSNSQPSDSLDEILENIHETVGMQEHEEPTLIDVPEKYVLPTRSNRGIPPKRYTPEKISKSFKYHIANIARGNLSKEAKAFFASVYSKEAPSNVEQALKSEK
nr:hypothetical protein [Tanacetum cinerariifolium]